LGSNEYGLVAPIYDDKKLGEHIYHILTNKDEYDRYSRLAKSKYKEFEPERISEQLEDFLKTLK
jgi:glycosyltransferase involved in cell wall biosynthesis